MTIDQLAQVEDAHDLEWALRRLKPRQAYVLLRKHVEGATFREIAGELGIGIARTQQIADRALRQLRHPVVGDRLLGYVEPTEEEEEARLWRERCDWERQLRERKEAQERRLANTEFWTPRENAADDEYAELEKAQRLGLEHRRKDWAPGYDRGWIYK